MEISPYKIMSSSILHRCSFCDHVSDISLGLAAFIENPHCNQCGLSASESNGKLQDELAALFEQQMTMTSVQMESQPPISYSISQHYHHSSHVVSPPDAPTSVLQQHGLDPATLSTGQLDLFVHADADQQQRLIQTWQLYARISSAGPNDDLEMQDSEDHGGEEDQREQAEPYMVSGYEVAGKDLPQEPTTGQPYTSSTDPVYKTGATGQWWESALAGSMESQYGAFQERNRCHLNYQALPAQWLCPS